MHLFRVSRRWAFVLVLAMASIVCASAAHAVMTLTTYGQNTRGFTLTTFATGFPVSGIGAGPFGVAYRTDGAVIVDHYNGNIYVFPNHNDNQVAGGILPTTYGTGPSLRGFVQIYSNGSYHYYLARQTANDVIEINPTTGATVRTVATLNQPVGLAAFPPPPLGPVNARSGHLFATTANGPIVDIDPNTPSPGNTSTFTDLGAVGDGLTFSPDGTILYVAKPGSNTVVGFSVPSTGTGTLTYTSPVISGGIDGIAIGLGTLSGYLYVNVNDGTLWEVGLPGGPSPGSANKVADSGTRGDFIAIDPSVYSGGPSGFPSLLVTQGDRIMRLDPAGGGWFGPPTSSTTLIAAAPALSPAMWAALALLLGGVALVALRRRTIPD